MRETHVLDASGRPERGGVAIVGRCPSVSLSLFAELFALHPSAGTRRSFALVLSVMEGVQLG